MLQGMKGSNLGVWVAHGEGKFMFKHSGVEKELEENSLVALRYTDDDGQATERLVFFMTKKEARLLVLVC